MLLNELFMTASRLSVTEGRSVVDPTYVFLDEFQRYLNPDIADALPTVRQMGLRLMFAHQSFSQLEKGDVDLTTMVWQARSRLVFANAGPDADIVADEIAKRQFDEMTVKDTQVSLRQLVVGHRKVITESWGATDTKSNASVAQSNLGYSYPLGDINSMTKNDGKSSGSTRADSSATTSSQRETYLPEHETIEEERKTFLTFEEFQLKIARGVRRQKNGEAVLITATEPDPRNIKVKWQPVPESSAVDRAEEELRQQNLDSGLFVSAAQIENDFEAKRLELLQSPTIVASGESPSSATDANVSQDDASLFRDH